MNNINFTLLSIFAIFSLSLTNIYAAEHNVTTKSELLQAISHAQGGDTINLANGNYGDNTFYGKNYTSRVTISGNGDNIILGRTNIIRSSNVSFENINFSRDMMTNEKNYTPILNIAFSDNINISNNDISSSNDSNTINDMTGISARGNTNLSIKGNSFSNLYKGFAGFDGSQLDISDNTFNTIGLVGVELGRNSRDSQITNNKFLNFYPCNTSSPKTCKRPGINISVWNSGGTKSLRNTQVSGNISFLGEGSFSQFIIARSNNSNNKISDITISQNSLYNNHINGVYIDSVDNGKVSNNSLIQGSFGAYNFSSNITKPYIRVMNSSNIIIDKNVSFGLEEKNNSSITQSQNILAQRTSSSKNTHISKLIFQDTLGSETTLGSLAPKQNSILDLGNNTYIGSQGYYKQEENVREIQTYNVDNNSSFVSALNKVQDGDSIILADGNYGDISIYGKIFDTGIKIQSKNTKKAIISKLQITASSNLHFQGIVFEHTKRDTEHDWSKVVYLNKSNNISIHHSEFRGSVDSNFTNDIEGFGARTSHNLHLSNNEFHNLEKGAVFDDTHSVIFANNSLHDIAVDGVAFGNNAVDIEITDNSFTNFRPCDIFNTTICKKHPDFIQMWNNNGTRANENITISNNSLVRGDGGVTQGILIQANNTTHQNKNFTISNNTISTSHIHGISVVDGENIVVENNSMTTSATLVTSPMNPNIWTINPRIRFYNIDSGSIKNNDTNWIDLINSSDIEMIGNNESLR